MQTRPRSCTAACSLPWEFRQGRGIDPAVLADRVAIIELLALVIGTRLTRTVTGAVAQLYNATEHINRRDFSHRIPVKSTDQLAPWRSRSTP